MWDKFLISLADELDEEGRYDLADDIDRNFNEFLDMLQNGEIDFSKYFTFPSGSRDPLQQRSNFGRGVDLAGIPGPQ